MIVGVFEAGIFGSTVGRFGVSLRYQSWICGSHANIVFTTLANILNIGVPGSFKFTTKASFMLAFAGRMKDAGCPDLYIRIAIVIHVVIDRIWFPAGG